MWWMRSLRMRAKILALHDMGLETYFFSRLDKERR